MVERENQQDEGGAGEAVFAASPVVVADALAASFREETSSMVTSEIEMSHGEDVPLRAASDIAPSHGNAGSRAIADGGESGTVTTAAASDLVRIRLKMLDERVVEVEAEPSMTVAEFRVKVAHATQVPVYRQRLIYRGKC